jgi:hypothetical protein
MKVGDRGFKGKKKEEQNRAEQSRIRTRDLLLSPLQDGLILWYFSVSVWGTGHRHPQGTFLTER